MDTNYLIGGLVVILVTTGLPLYYFISKYGDSREVAGRNGADLNASIKELTTEVRRNTDNQKALNERFEAELVEMDRRVFRLEDAHYNKVYERKTFDEK